MSTPHLINFWAVSFQPHTAPRGTKTKHMHVRLSPRGYPATDSLSASAPPGICDYSGISVLADRCNRRRLSCTTGAMTKLNHSKKVKRWLFLETSLVLERAARPAQACVGLHETPQQPRWGSARPWRPCDVL